MDFLENLAAEYYEQNPDEGKYATLQQQPRVHEPQPVAIVPEMPRCLYCGIVGWHLPACGKDEPRDEQLGARIAAKLRNECLRRDAGKAPQLHVNNYLATIDDVVALGDAREILEPECGRSPLVATVHELLAERIMKLCY